jgi:hypothetical protein
VSDIRAKRWSGISGSDDFAIVVGDISTVPAGLQHIAPKPAVIGYDEILKPKSTQTADVAPRAVEFLMRRTSRRRSRYLVLARLTPAVSLVGKPRTTRDDRAQLPAARYTIQDTVPNVHVSAVFFDVLPSRLSLWLRHVGRRPGRE